MVRHIQKQIKRQHCGTQVKGPHFDPRGPTLLLLSVVLLLVLRFLPIIPLLGGGMPPHDLAKTNNSKI